MANAKTSPPPFAAYLRWERSAPLHFRNIRGGPDHFEETFLDEGDGDMFLYMQTYRDVGFEGPFMMDHTPGAHDRSAMQLLDIAEEGTEAMTPGACDGAPRM